MVQGVARVLVRCSDPRFRKNESWRRAADELAGEQGFELALLGGVCTLARPFGFEAFREQLDVVARMEPQALEIVFLAHEECKRYALDGRTPKHQEQDQKEGEKIARALWKQLSPAPLLVFRCYLWKDGRVA